MKLLIPALLVSALILPFTACTSVSHTEDTHGNWDGSTTHTETTVKEHPNGTVTVDKETERTR